ncbi:MAG: septum formation initiator family protein [Edaphocola sp.]
MKKLFRFLVNKYLITAVLFLLLMLFFDQNDWFTQHGREKELETIQGNIDHLKAEINTMDNNLNKLNGQNEELERVAREKYYEKKDGEDVYIFVADTVKTVKK